MESSEEEKYQESCGSESENPKYWQRSSAMDYQLARTISRGEPRYSHVFAWSGGGAFVTLHGDFNDWKGQKMDR